MSKEYVRVTVTLPKKISEKLNKYVSKGDKSKFVSDSLNEKLLELEVKKKTKNSPLSDLFEASKLIKKRYTTDEIIDFINEDRKK